MTTDYGQDTSCTDALAPGRLSRGVRLVAEAAYRRLITPRGALRGGEAEANYGLDITRMIGQLGGDTQARMWESRIRGELLKDARLRDCTVTITSTVDSARESWLVRVDGETEQGPFELVMDVGDVTVDLVGLTS